MEATVVHEDQVVMEATNPEIVNAIAGAIQGALLDNCRGNLASHLYEGIYYAVVRGSLEPAELFKQLAAMLEAGAQAAQQHVDENEAKRAHVEKLLNDAGFTWDDRFAIMIATGL